jgi:hypothetical protein
MCRLGYLGKAMQEPKDKNRTLSRVAWGGIFGAVAYFAFFTIPLGMGSNLPGIVLFSLIGSVAGLLFSKIEGRLAG